MILKGSRWDIHRRAPRGGFPYDYAWVNSVGLIEGQINKCEEFTSKKPKWETQPLGLLAPTGQISGNITYKTVNVKEVKGVPKLSTWEKLRLKTPAWSQVNVIQPELNTLHQTWTLTEAAKQHLTNVSKILGVKDVYNSRRDDLFFFCLREGEVFVNQMLVGRKLAGAQVYYEANHKTASDIHNNVLRRYVFKNIFKICEAYFNMIASLDLETIKILWNPRCRDKQSQPAWSMTVMIDCKGFWPRYLDDIMTVHLRGKNAYDVKMFSWNWWYNFFINELIPRPIREYTWANVQNWYSKAGVTYSDINALQLEAIDLNYGKYDEPTHLVLDLSPACGFSTHGRDSTGPIESTYDPTMNYWSVKCTEDKQRDVSRSFTSALSIIETPELTNYVMNECHQKLVINGPMWMRNKRCLSGCDAKNSDQQSGINWNLCSYGKVRQHKIDALGEASGELWTPYGNEVNEHDQDNELNLLRYVRTYAGDDIGLDLWDPKEYLETHEARWAWSFKAFSAKQTLEYHDDNNEFKHLVFNLGNTFVYNSDRVCLGQFRSPKIVKTEQTPIGNIKGNTTSWSIPEFGKASLDDVIKYEQVLWYCESIEQFEEFIPRLMQSGQIWNLADIPDSIKYLI